MKEKLKKFFSKYKEYFYIILIIVLLISFFCFFGFSKENMDKLFYSYLLTTLIYLLFFRLDLFERYIIRNITIILILGIIFIMYYQTFLGIDNKDTLLMVGGIIAFWYGYKKYERDKELEIIEKYTNKYNQVNNELFILKSDEKKDEQMIKKNYMGLLSLFYEEYYLYSKGYISNSLWNEWNEWIEIDIYDLIDYDFNKFHSDDDIIITNILKTYLGIDKKKICRYEGKVFFEYIQSIINKYPKISIKKELESKKLFSKRIKKILSEYSKE